MAAIVEFSIKTDRIAMSEALAATPGVEVDIVQEAGTDPDRPVLLFWAHGGDLDAFDDALAEDPTVNDIERYAEPDEQVLYRVRVTDAVDLVTYPVWVEVGAEQIEARYRDGWWENRYRVPNTDALETIEQWCTDNGIAFELDGVYSQESQDSDETGLTAEQREILQTALEMGYFEVPRQGTLEDVAGALDISSQAASERMRRGHKQLLERHL